MTAPNPSLIRVGIYGGKRSPLGGRVPYSVLIVCRYGGECIADGIKTKAEAVAIQRNIIRAIHDPIVGAPIWSAIGTLANAVRGQRRPPPSRQSDIGRLERELTP